MNDIINILKIISSGLGRNGNLNPFTAGLESDEIASLNNNDDKFTDENIREDFQTTINKFLAEENSSSKNTAETLSKELNKILSKKEIEIGSAKWFKNYNAAISAIGNKNPELRNALRANALGQIEDKQSEIRDLENPLTQSRIAKKAWAKEAWAKEAAELAYKGVGDKVRANESDLKKALAELPEQINDKGEGADNKAIQAITKNFGSIANFNQLLKDNGINYQINENDGKYTVGTVNYNDFETSDAEGANPGYRKNLNNWNQNAGELINVNLDDFDIKNAKEVIDKYRNLTNFDSDTLEEFDLNEGRKILETLTQANMYDLMNEGESFSLLELNTARRNIIRLIHDAENKARTEQSSEYIRPENLNNAIKDINTLYHLRREGGIDSITASLNQAAKALEHKGYNNALGGDGSKLSELIGLINNEELAPPPPAPTETTLPQINPPTPPKTNKN